MVKKLILLILIFIVFYLRFAQIDQLGYFMLDEERDAFLVRRMLVDKRPLLIGGSIPGGINVGPAFFYISAIPYYLSRLNPLGPAWAAAAAGVIGVIGVFWVGKELFGRRVGLLAAVFAGFSLVNIIYQRPWWPLTMSQAVTLVVYLSLWRLVRGDSLPYGKESPHLKKWLWVLIAVLVVGAQSDPSTLSLIPLSAIWLWRHRRRIELTGKHYLAAAGLFVLAHATWVVFELRHNFISSRAIINLLGTIFKGQSLQGLSFFGGVGGVIKMTAATVYRLFIPTGPLDVAGQISPAEVFLNQRLTGIWWPLAWIMLILIVLYAIFYSQKRYPTGKHFWENRATGRLIFGWHFLISLGGILVYTMVFPGYVHEWMWFFMFPGFFLMTADILVSLERRWKFAKLVRVRSFANFSVAIWAVWQMSLFLKLENVAGLGEKLRVVQAAQAEIVGRPYELRSEGEGALRYGGWRYLFTLYGDPPVKSYMDYVYQDWVYPRSKVVPEMVVVINNPADKSAVFTISENSEYSESPISPENQNF